MDPVFVEGCAVPDLLQERANASFVILARNSELDDVVKSMKSLERHFNQWYGYPYVFLNDEEFTDDFKKGVRNYTNSKVEFGVIDLNQWRFKDEDTLEFKEFVETQGDRGIMYGSVKSYHSMCRFYSGFFHKHPLVRQYEWYWRVEPDVEFYCDLTYDPFVEMQKRGKKYGFTIMIKEIWETVPNLFRLTKGFLKENELKSKSSWKLFVQNYKDKWIYSRDVDTRYPNFKDEWDLSNRIRELTKIKALLKVSKNMGNKGDAKLKSQEIKELVKKAVNLDRLPQLQGEQIDSEDYNLYHFWSNFEIARVDLWDNPIYDKYFEYLDSTGGFYKERWGDAPIHSLAIGFMLDLEEIHYFRDIGYKHTTIAHCPANAPNQLPYKPSKNYKGYGKKFEKFWSHIDPVESYGMGCRCRCPSGHKDIEDTGNDFLKDWFEMTGDDYKKPRPININKLERKLRKEYKIA